MDRLVLIASRIWHIERRTRLFINGRSLSPTIVIIVESGAIYSATLISLLTTYLSGSWGQYPVLDSVSLLFLPIPQKTPSWLLYRRLKSSDVYSHSSLSVSALASLLTRRSEWPVCLIPSVTAMAAAAATCTPKHGQLGRWRCRWHIRSISTATAAQNLPAQRRSTLIRMMHRSRLHESVLHSVLCAVLILSWIMSVVIFPFPIFLYIFIVMRSCT